MAEVVRRYLPQVLRAARGAGLAPHQAEEVTQETFKTFVEGVHRFEGRSQVRTWLFGILYNKIAEQRRDLAREPRNDPIEEEFESWFSAEAIERYKVEPYVSCADVYSVAPLAGRGGWTWYTGSAGWLYRAGLEAMLGFHVRGNRVLIDPCIPKAWSGFSITYRHRSSRYVIEVENPAGTSRGIAKVELDGVAVTGAPAPASGAEVPLHDDGAQHHVRVELG